MREVQASDAKTHLPQLLDEVERGETIVITRHGRPIARLVPEAEGSLAEFQTSVFRSIYDASTVPEAERRQTEIRAAIDAIKALRRTGPKLSADEIHALINEGRKY